jgi:hypothetical protein
MYHRNRPYGIVIGTVILGILFLLSLLVGRADSAYPAGCTELINNGGFEAGSTGWVQYSASGFNLISDFYPHTGRLGAYLGGANNADDRLSQAVVLPSGAITITLRLWWAMTTAEAGGVFDTLTVSLLHGDGTPLATLATLDNSAAVNQWDELSFDLTAYAGQSVVLSLAAATDSQYPTDFYMDDVSITACSTAGTPSPTLSATTSPTGTSTPSPSATASPTGTPGKVYRKSYLPQVIK